MVNDSLSLNLETEPQFPTPGWNIKAPSIEGDIFGSKNFTGKTTFPNMSLEFIREGSTYTISKVRAAEEDNNRILAENLNKLRMTAGSEYPHIWSNNFWPMDKVWTYGANDHDLKFGDSTKKSRRKYGEGNKTFPPGDDGDDHNSYFGMSFTADFTVDPGYIGPLEYFFFGDDDMWVYLTDMETHKSKLIVDLGGVHSSVGEYVNLWDYIRPIGFNETSHPYRLTFFYTERGASGSTCYMRFTIPLDSKIIDPDKDELDTYDLKIEKQVAASDDVKQIEEIEEKEFEYELDLYFDGTNSAYYDLLDYTLFEYHVVSEGGEKISSGVFSLYGENGQHEKHTFKLKDKGYIIVKDLPAGVSYTVTEINPNAHSKIKYSTTYEQGTYKDSTDPGFIKREVGTTATGALKDGSNNYVRFTNTVDSMLMVTKTVNTTGSATIQNEEFKYEVKLDGITATELPAIEITRNPTTKKWQGTVSSIELQTTNDGLLLDKDCNPVMVGDSYVRIKPESLTDMATANGTYLIYEAGVSSSMVVEDSETGEKKISLPQGVLQLIKEVDNKLDLKNAQDYTGGDLEVAVIKNPDEEEVVFGNEVRSGYNIKTNYKTTDEYVTLADFTLKDGQGYAFLVPDGTGYTVTEKLTDDQYNKAGIRLQQITQKQKRIILS